MTAEERFVAIVTGGGSGIGRASTLALTDSGATVVVADVNAEAAGAVEAEVRTRRGTAKAVPVDVTDPDAVDRLVGDTVSEFGQIDALVHCAGIAPKTPALDISLEEWERVIRTNLTASFIISRAVAREMIKRSTGTIILMASDAGVHGLARHAHYSASKGGVIALAKSLARELGSQGVTVNALNPGTTDTPMVRGNLNEDERRKVEAQDPLGRLSAPEEIAEIILFLARKGGRFITGQLVTTRMRLS